MRKMEVYYIEGYDQAANQHHINVIETNLGTCHCLSSLQEFLTREPKADVIVLSMQQESNLASEIQKIRRSDEYFLTPILLSQAPVDRDILMMDGNLEDIATAIDKILSIQEYSSQINLYLQDWRSRLLYFLFTRPHLSFKPFCDWHLESYYDYPIIKCFTDETQDAQAWLTELSQQKILTASNQIDQLFCCPNCYSAHIKFTDHCPSCNSIHIQSTDFYHCFTCGLISPQNEFIRGEKLICPKCNTQLRHVGDDYDKPLESGLCQDCNEFYMDAKLQATCMICRKNYATDRLHHKKIYEYKLTAEGRKHIQFNTVNEINSIFDSASFYSQEFFYAALHWIMSLQRNYQSEQFSILGLRLPTLARDDLFDAYEFIQQLKLVLRKIDLITRLNEHYVWIILPKTNEQEAHLTMNCIKTLVESMDMDDENKEKFKYTLFTSSPEKIEDEKSNSLIAKLTTQL